jgi:hypothetical protein
MGPNGNHLSEEVRAWAAEKGKQLGVNSQKKETLPFISNRIFRRIELKHWSAALNDGD